VVAGEHSRVVVERSAYTPVFGADEESLLRSLAGHLDMALGRIAAFEASEAARLDAQRAAERLHQLVYGISHDLKNPLVTVMGFAGLLAEEADGLSQDGRMFLSRIQASTGYMQRLIDDLLQLSRVGRTECDPTDVDLRQLVEDIGSDIQARYPGVSVACHDDATLRINPVRARQLLINLIENAARHGRRDRLHVQVTARCRDDGFVDLLVTDDGVGVPPEHREKVFGIFERLDGFSTDSEGTGVGLTICRRIAEDLSGSIEILDSQVGTHVRVVLPRSASVQAEVVSSDA
jgi:signal transduction histidine kinase